MAQIEKTVFISYRRTNFPWAKLVYTYLRKHKYDVFFDFTSIPSGDFEQIILSNIKARAHFLLILTPTALDRCNQPGDWVRREIEFAIDQKRNIIPLFFEKFSFSSPSVEDKLTGKLSALKHYNGLEVPSNFFEAAMSQLRKQFLNAALDTVLHPVSMEVQEIVKQEQAAADRALIEKGTNNRQSSAKKEVSETFNEPTPQSLQGKKVEESKDIPGKPTNESYSQPHPPEIEAGHNTISDSSIPRRQDKLTFYPTVELTLRTQPVISPETVIRRISVREQLLGLEPASIAMPKVGVKNQWLKVKDRSGMEGYVAAWCVTQSPAEFSKNAFRATEDRIQGLFEAALGSLAEEASSEIVQKELDAISQAAPEDIERIRESALPLNLRLQRIVKELSSGEIGRDTTMKELNAILARIPKTQDVKG